MLYTSLIALLRDWFPPEDYNLSSLLTLLSMAEARENDENFKSPLDLLFLQIEEGKRYIPNEGGAPAPSMGISGLSRNFGTGNATGDSDWSWEPTNLKRNSDGVRPADCGGLSPDEDFALMNYKNFKVAAGVVSLKRLLNQSNLKSWSSKMIKKSLEAYFFTLKNKIVFCKKQFQNMSVFCFVSTEIV